MIVRVTTSMSFVTCLMICSSVSGSPLQVIVMREKSPLATSALTTRLSMLYPRRENTRATRTSTPGLVANQDRERVRRGRRGESEAAIAAADMV